MFGSGYALGSQAALIFTSHFWREEMMDLSFVAPGLVLFPLQDRSEALPPPTSITLLAIGPKSPFLAVFLFPVLLYLLILFCCTKKFVILLFTIFISFTAVSRQVEFTVREHNDLSSPSLLAKIFCPFLAPFSFTSFPFFLFLFTFPLFLCLVTFPVMFSLFLLSWFCCSLHSFNLQAVTFYCFLQLFCLIFFFIC